MAKSSTKALKQKIALITTGSHNPPHQGHIDMLLQAKRHLVGKGYDVTKVIVSPSHDNYLASKSFSKLDINGVKFKRPRLNAKTRRALWKELIAGSGKNIELSNYESKHLSTFCEHTDLVNTLKSREKDKTILYVYVAGEDLANSCMPLWKGQPSPFNVICVGRDNNAKMNLAEQFSKAKKKTKANIFTYIPNENISAATSSTGLMSGNKSQLALHSKKYLSTLLRALEQDHSVSKGYRRALKKRIDTCKKNSIDINETDKKISSNSKLNYLSNLLPTSLISLLIGTCTYLFGLSLLQVLACMVTSYIVVELSKKIIISPPLNTRKNENIKTTQFFSNLPSYDVSLKTYMPFLQANKKPKQKNNSHHAEIITNTIKNKLRPGK